MQEQGVWLIEGQSIDSDGSLHGTPRRSDIASFWLNGVAAAFVTWSKLVLTFIDAEEDYDKTGNEEALTKFYNNDLGEPYMPKSMESERLPEVIKSRAENWGSTPDEPTVPDNVRFLEACVDVQKNAFVAQIHGVSPGQPADLVLIDRFTIQKSERSDEEGDRLWVKPGVYLDDWDLIEDLVMKKTYPLADGSGRRMMIKMTCCDSGGKAGVTSNAYQFFRRLRERGTASRFVLVKGDHKPGAPRVRVSYPDSSNTKNKAAAQGDVPILSAQL
jgi:phage terminase large subunit GpA-like protein